MGVKPTGQIKPNQLFDTDYIGLELLPPEFVDLSAQLRLAVKQFSDANVVANVNDKLNRLGTLVDSANKLIGDEKMQSDVKAAIANFKEVSTKVDKLAADANAAIAQAKTTLAKADGKVDELSNQLSARLAEVSKLLGEVTTAAAKINAGEGTAGKLVNDPKLYEGLVLTVESLNATVKDLQRLIQQWEQEGASIKLK